MSISGVTFPVRVSRLAASCVRQTLGYLFSNLSLSLSLALSDTRTHSDYRQTPTPTLPENAPQ